MIALFMISTFSISSQHVKRAALRDFNAVSAEVLCEVRQVTACLVFLNPNSSKVFPLNPYFFY